MKRWIFGILYAITLVSFTVYSIMDTFVLAKQIETEAVDYTSEDEVVKDYSDAQGEFTDTTYKDQYMSVEIKTYREYNTDIYVADIHVDSPELLKTAFTNDTYGKNIVATTSETARAHKAVVAIDGDFYGVHNHGYVARNGVLYRDVVRTESQFEDLVIYKDGNFEMVNEKDQTAQELMEKGARDIFMFGPALIKDYEIVVDANTEVTKRMVSNPRTAIAQIGYHHYAFVVSDGRTERSAGLTLLQLAKFMQKIGADQAYNLDGGGSSSMVFNNRVINQPTHNGYDIVERAVSDIVYIGY